MSEMKLKGRFLFQTVAASDITTEKLDVDIKHCKRKLLGNVTCQAAGPAQTIVRQTQYISYRSRVRIGISIS